jgi:glutamate N-acetyltransferase/amino-acid N-acetyltransferase
VIVNSRNANCATGEAGMAASEATAQAIAREIGCDPEQVFVCSTGVIGLPLRVERILQAVPALVKMADRTVEGFGGFTRAIMTTDTRPKWAASRCTLSGRTIRLLGCTKGAGMIHPNMATMLAYIVTDASISSPLLQRALKRVVSGTFNSITVDGDTSTNDTLLALASGAAGNRTITKADADYRRLLSALENVCHSLALQIVADGEGATRVIEIEVRGAASDDAAGVKIDPRRANIYLADVLTCRGGVEHSFSETRVHNRMLRDFVPVRVELGMGRGRACVWTCDFTSDYVHINAAYRT